MDVELGQSCQGTLSHSAVGAKRGLLSSDSIVIRIERKCVKDTEWCNDIRSAAVVHDIQVLVRETLGQDFTEAPGAWRVGPRSPHPLVLALSHCCSTDKGQSLPPSL